MRKMLLAGAAALTFTAVPSVLFAQDADGPTTTTVTTTEQVPVTSSTQKPYVMTVQQKTTYATWPADRQTSYQAWPIENQTYYWTLTPEQQAGYWALTPDQQGQIYKMSPEQRAIAWQSIQQQMAGQTPTTPEGQANPPGQGMPTAGVPNPQSAEQAARPAMPADPGYQGGPYKGALTPPPADAMNKSYPVCSKTVTDGCRNRGGK